MAQLKDLIVSGASRLIGNAFANNLQITTLIAPTSAGGSTYGTGTNGQILKSNGSSIYWDTSEAASYSITDSSSASAIGTGTSLTTERDIYYGLPTINNSHTYTSSTTIYAPTGAGTANQILVSAGGTSAPTWKATASGAAYATSSNGALTFGTLPIAQGGTGKTSAAEAWTNLGGGAIGKLAIDGSSSTKYLRGDGTWQNAPVTSVAGKTGAVTLGTLTIGDATYNGSSNTSISIADLGIASTTTFWGMTSTAVTDGSTTATVNITVGPTTGNRTATSSDNGVVVMRADNGEEFIWTGSKWNLMGLASSYALAQHVHGNINNGGAILSDTTAASGQHLVITDSNNKVARSSLTFGTDTNQFLCNDGSWQTPVIIRGTGNYSAQQVTSTNSSYQASATGEGAFALGAGVASGQLSFAGGAKSSSVDYSTTASANGSFAYGLSTKAEKNYSVAFGQRTTAKGLFASAFGNYTIASGRAAMAIGQYNIEDTDVGDTATYGTEARKYLFTIGNGTADDARSNALTVDWEGNVEASGLVKSKGFNNLFNDGTAINGVNNSGTYTPLKWYFDKDIVPNDGDIFTIKIPSTTNGDYGVFLSLNNQTNYYPIAIGSTTRLTTHYAVNNYITVIFEANGQVNSVYPLAGGTARTNISTGGIWRVLNYYDSNTYTSAYCSTGASTVAKGASCNGFTLQPNSYIHIIFTNTNTAANPTLTINSTGAKPIFVNGAAATTSNLVAGAYLAYYDGTNYQLRTDGKLPANISGNADTATSATSATQDGSGNTITSYYQKKHTVIADLSIPFSSSTTATVIATGVTATNSVIVTPTPAQWTNWRDKGIRCTAQAANSLTFTADSSITLTTAANVIIFEE